VSLFIFAVVWIMPASMPEELTLFTKAMPGSECQERAARLQARHDGAGRWAKGMRFFAVRCVGIPSGGQQHGR
jgi:hypothetical protein